MVGIGHGSDRLVDRSRRMMGIGDRHIEGIADQVERAGARLRIDQPVSGIDPVAGIVDLAIDGALEPRTDEPIDRRAQILGLAARQVRRVEAQRRMTLFHSPEKSDFGSLFQFLSKTL
ncbi:MAG: hypothetical protein JKY97_07510, partial [Citromicrobium sp.]|nr:hypothetical protein [Citromicrobium sp.]